MPGIIQKIARYAKAHGWPATCRRALRRLNRLILERSFDWRYGVNTNDKLLLHEAYANNSDYHAYHPATYASVRECLKRIKIRPQEDVFIDFGCGKGRVLCVAARLPFRKVIGVELLPELSRVAWENINKMTDKVVAQDVRIVTSKAAEFPVPHDASVIYFFNPFKGAELAAVIENIRRALLEKPRELKIIFNNPDEFERLVGTADWLFKEQEFHLGGRHVIYRSNLELLRNESRKAGNLPA